MQNTARVVPVTGWLAIEVLEVRKALCSYRGCTQLKVPPAHRAA